MENDQNIIIDKRFMNKCPRGTRRKYLNKEKTKWECVKTTDTKKGEVEKRRQKYYTFKKRDQGKNIQTFFNKPVKPLPPVQQPLLPVVQEPVVEEPVVEEPSVEPEEPTEVEPTEVEPTEVEPVDDIEEPMDLDKGVVPLTELEEKGFSKNNRLYALRKEKAEYDASTKIPTQLYPDVNDKEFADKIAQKKEFFHTQYDPKIYNIEEKYEILCNIPIDFHPHQLFVRNFLSSETPYNSLLLYHGLGTGKTATAIGVAEEMRQYMKQVGHIRPIYIIANTNVRDNFMKELFNEDLIPQNLADLKNRHLPFYMNEFLKEVNPTLEYTNITREELITSVNRLIRKYYHFYGYRKLAIEIFELLKKDGDVLSERSKQSIRAKFNDSLMIVDEVHNIRANTENDLGMQKVGELLTTIVTHAEKMRLLLMSATPVFNSYSEIIWLTNLLNINDKRPKIKTSEVFYTRDEKEGEFKEEERLENGMVIEGGRELLARKLNGYVSFIRGENPYSFPYRIYPDYFDPSRTFQLASSDSNSSNVSIPYPSKQFNGRVIPDDKKLKYVKLYTNRLDAYQENIYQCILNFSKKSKSIGEGEEEGDSLKFFFNIQPIIQSLNMVFPTKANVENMEMCSKLEIADALGDKGFDGVMEKRGKQYRYRPNTPRIFAQAELPKYSSKISNILSSIQNATGIVLVYSQYLKSGIVSVAMALEEAGISKYDEAPLLQNAPTVAKLDALTMKPDIHTQTPAKYIMITGNKELSADNDAMIRKAIELDNMYGKNIKVILISGAGTEGIDFKNIRQVHIMEPWYNMNKMEQVIGRAVRHKSHCAMPFKERNVEIYLHTSLLSTDTETETIDTFVYRHYAEWKAVQIGKINRLLKEVSIDVRLNLGQMNMTVDKLQTLSQNQNMELQIASRKATDQLLLFPVGDKPHTETCDYMECEYTKKTPPLEQYVQTSTYNAVYIKRSNMVLVPKIKALFRENAFYTKKDLLFRLNQVKVYPLEEIYSALSYLIQSPNEKLLDKKGRLGRLIRKGDVYLFQPKEERDENISVMERTIPKEYMKSSLLVTVPSSVSRSTSSSSPVETEDPLNRFRKFMAEINDPDKPADSWLNEFKRINYRANMEFSLQTYLAGFDQDRLHTCFLHHYLESLPFKQKVALLKQTVFYGPEGSESAGSGPEGSFERSDYGSDSGSDSGSVGGSEGSVGGSDGSVDKWFRKTREYFERNNRIPGEAVYYVYKEVGKNNFYFYHWNATKKEWTLGSNDTENERAATLYLNKKEQERVFVNVSPIFGFMSWNKKANQYELKTKTRGLTDKYNKGSLCANQNRDSPLNKLMIKEFPEFDFVTKNHSLTVRSKCVLTEILLRYYAKEKKSFFSPEEFSLDIV